MPDQERVLVVVLKRDKTMNADCGAGLPVPIVRGRFKKKTLRRSLSKPFPTKALLIP